MLCVNNKIMPISSCSFKQNERQFVFNVGKKLIDADTYIKDIDKAIFSRSIKSYSDFVSIIKTCNFAKVQYAKKVIDTERDIYKKIIQKCVDDMEKAIANRESAEKVDKLESVLELFIRKFGYLE